MKGTLLFIGWVNVAAWALLLLVWLVEREPTTQEAADRCLTLGVVLLIAANTKGLGLPK